MTMRRVKQPVLELPVPPASTPASPSEDTTHRKECRGSFRRLLASLKPNALPAGALCQILKTLGMASEVDGDKLSDMLKLSGYADEDGTLEFEQYFVFAKDFKLLESLRAQRVSSLKGELDRGPLGNFFRILEAGEVLGFSDNDFIEAFEGLNMTLTDEDADSLVRYADLHRGVSISFEQFLKVLHRTDEGHMRRTGQMKFSRRTVVLDRGQPLGRMMAFVSSYTRSAM